MSFISYIARRYLFIKQKEAFISVLNYMSILGIAISVAVLIIAMSIMSGFQSVLQEKLLGVNAHIVVTHLNGGFKGWRPVKKKLMDIKGVKGVSAYTEYQVLVRGDRKASGLLLRGIEANNSSGMPILSYLQKGGVNIERAFSLQEKDGVIYPPLVIGRQLADAYYFNIGDIVTVITPTFETSAFGILPRFKRFIVSAIYDTGLAEYEKAIAYSNLLTMQQSLGLEDIVLGFEIQLKDINRAPLVSKKIKYLLANLRENALTQDWTEMNKPLWEALALEKRVYFIVLLLLICLASFSIISTLIMMVIEKRKDIAILQTIGVTKQEISLIFQLMGFVEGVIGTILGIALGVLGGVALQKYGFPLDPRIFPVDKVPVDLDYLTIILIAISALVISWVATIYPAKKASSIDPAKVLRYE